MKTLYNIRLFVIAVMALMATGAFAQDTLPVPLNFRSDGGTQAITIDETNVSWKLTCDAQWVHITPAEGTGAATVTLTVDANATGQAREANLVLDTGYGFVNTIFVLKQKGNVSTDITGPTSENGKRTNDIRTLSGMKMRNGNLRRGVYIINGKKVVK